MDFMALYKFSKLGFLCLKHCMHVLTHVVIYQTPEFCCRTAKLRTLLFVDNTGYKFTALWTITSVKQFFICSNEFNSNM